MFFPPSTVCSFAASTSTSTTAKTSSHVTPCSDSQRNFCVNGGECYILKITEGNTKFLCRCLAGYTGHRCEQAVLKKVSDPKPDELYQKRVLTITGICIALLVVGIMCVVAYCKTNKQRRKLRERLRQSLKKKRNNNTSSCSASKQTNSTTEPQVSSLPLHDLQLISVIHMCVPWFTGLSDTGHRVNDPPCLCSWSNDWSDSVLSDAESVSVMSLVENGQRATQVARGRLNATGGTSDLSVQSEKCRDTPSREKSISELISIKHFKSLRVLRPGSIKHTSFFNIFNVITVL
uniref:EGF-like domain-containing protein n=1 Tax=Gouania willdenowi TaxID=441366 RepID=A0A8C5HPZ4_GOUWI